MKKIILIILMFTCGAIFAQDSLKIKKDNRILYVEFTTGNSPYDGYNPYVSSSINYQKKNHLFKISISEALLPDKIEGSKEYFLGEYNPTLFFSGLYGQRFIIEKFSFSISGGVSYIITKKINHQENSSNRTYKISNGIGIPLELNIKIFKAKKQKFRVLCGIMSIGKPTSIGVSMGLKVFANISKKSFAGLGLTFGLGSHKVYK